MHKILLPIALLWAMMGCAQTRSYDISVKNQTPRPITLVLEKEGGPREDAWTTPEEFANGTARDGVTWGLGVVPPGKTAAATQVKGQFDPGARAWLRVYGGDLSLGEMLKIKAGSPNREDMPIKPGSNNFVVRAQGEGIQVSPLAASK